MCSTLTNFNLILTVVKYINEEVISCATFASASVGRPVNYSRFGRSVILTPDVQPFILWSGWSTPISIALQQLSNHPPQNHVAGPQFVFSDWDQHNRTGHLLAPLDLQHPLQLSPFYRRRAAFSEFLYCFCQECTNLNRFALFLGSDSCAGSLPVQHVYLDR